MSIYKGPNTLSANLAKHKMQLQKLKKVQVDDRFQYLLKATGKYVCILTSFPNMNNSHAIGVDCDCSPKMIYDSYDQRAVELTIENLNVCSGFPDSVFGSIYQIGKLFFPKKL